MIGEIPESRKWSNGRTLSTPSKGHFCGSPTQWAFGLDAPETPSECECPSFREQGVIAGGKSLVKILGAYYAVGGIAAAGRGNHGSSGGVLAGGRSTVSFPASLFPVGGVLGAGTGSIPGPALACVDALYLDSGSSFTFTLNPGQEHWYLFRCPDLATYHCRTTSGDFTVAWDLIGGSCGAPIYLGTFLCFTPAGPAGVRCIVKVKSLGGSGVYTVENTAGIC